MPSVNSATAKLAPREGMVQLGQALKRLIALMTANRSKGKNRRVLLLFIRHVIEFS